MGVRMKMLGVVLFACLCFFFVYVLLAGTPLERLNRSCLPATWMGRAFTTAASFSSPSAEEKTQEGAGSLYNGCRYFLYRQFYAEEHRELKAQYERSKESGGGKKQEAK